MPSSGRWVALFAGEFRPAGRGTFPAMGKYPKDRRGTAQNGHFVSIFALPPDPHYGGRVPVRMSKISGAQNLSGDLRFLPGRWALGLQKLPLVRFRICAWVSRTNAPGRYAVGPVWDRPLREKGAASISAVGAAVSRLQAFPLGGRCPSAHTGADEGAMIERFFV